MQQVKAVEDMPDYIKVAKHNDFMADWRTDVAGGSPHPILIEHELYTKIMIGKLYIDMAHDAPNISPAGGRGFNRYEEEEIKGFLRRPEMAWANDNSFDGVYIRKEPDYAQMRVIMVVYAYMKEQHVTFWKLKFTGQMHL